MTSWRPGCLWVSVLRSNPHHTGQCAMQSTSFLNCISARGPGNPPRAIRKLFHSLLEEELQEEWISGVCISGGHSV